MGSSQSNGSILEKCRILYFGFNNPEISYELNGSPLLILIKLVDPGITKGADTICNQHSA